MPTIRIRARLDGPYVLEPDDDVTIELLDHERRPIPLPEKRPIALCRCGHSGQKPFCDGSHKRLADPADAAGPGPG